jgi:hypothetical protein
MSEHRRAARGPRSGAIGTMSRLREEQETMSRLREERATMSRSREQQVAR